MEAEIFWEQDHHQDNDSRGYPRHHQQPTIKSNQFQFKKIHRLSTKVLKDSKDINQLRKEDKLVSMVLLT